MGSSRQTDKSDARRLVEAAAWRSHLTETDAESSEAFEAWLAADLDNEIAWRQVQAPWTFFGEQATSPELIEARREALREAHNASRNRWRSRLVPARLLTRAIAASVLIAAAGVILVWSLTGPDIYRTALGERRIVMLADGSKVTLDARSEVQVRYSERMRDLKLTQGQARFDVAHDIERPFSVVAGGQKIIATGTAFNVDLLDANVLVTLIEGRVVVLPQVPTRLLGVFRPEPSPSSEEVQGRTPLHQTESDRLTSRQAARSTQRTSRGIELTVGEQLIISPAAPPRIVAVSLDRATAWQYGRLVFEDEPLSTVAARVNRYTEREVRIADDATAQLRISGVLNAGDIDSFIATISSYLPVRAEPAEDGAIEVRRR